MSYKSYVLGGIISRLRHGMVITQIGKNQKPDKDKQLKKCIDCPEMIVCGKNRKRCSTCADINLRNNHIKYQIIRRNRV